MRFHRVLVPTKARQSSIRRFASLGRIYAEAMSGRLKCATNEVRTELEDYPAIALYVEDGYILLRSDCGSRTRPRI
jgi:hypothetical protein